MSVIIIFLQKAIAQGIGMLYGALGEIVTEKSGNLNLGVPGVMYMGGIVGLMGAFFYENGNPAPNGLVGLIISFLCAFLAGIIGGLIYSILTITLRANQNVTGLALTPSEQASETSSAVPFPLLRAVSVRSPLPQLVQLIQSRSRC